MKKLRIWMASKPGLNSKALSAASATLSRYPCKTLCCHKCSFSLRQALRSLLRYKAKLLRCRGQTTEAIAVVPHLTCLQTSKRLVQYPAEAGPYPTQPVKKRGMAADFFSLFQGWPLSLAQLPSKGPCPKAQAHSPSLCPGIRRYAVSERDGRARGT